MKIYIDEIKERHSFKSYKDYMIWRIDKRVEWVTKKAEKLKEKYIKTLGDTDGNAEQNRLWLDQFAKGKGFDICCGDFLIGSNEQAIGIDGSNNMLGADYCSEGDDLTFQHSNTLDYIVTNYFEAIANPIKGLNEWHRCLKPAGVLAIVCRDAEKFDSNMGVLENPKRRSCYTSLTLKNYLYRAGFQEVYIEREGLSKSLRAKAVK